MAEFRALLQASVARVGGAREPQLLALREQQFLAPLKAAIYSVPQSGPPLLAWVPGAHPLA